MNESLRAELERAREVNENLEDDLHLAQSQPKSLGSNDEGVNWKVRYDDLERRHQELQLDLQEQQEVSHVIFYVVLPGRRGSCLKVLRVMPYIDSVMTVLGRRTQFLRSSRTSRPRARDHIR